MAYRYAIPREDYSDFSSGKVLFSAPGYPAFPIRLGDEMFLRTKAYLPRDDLLLWDPCCGSGYLATVLALRHASALRGVLCTDADREALALARQNTQLLNREGLADRAQLLRTRAASFGKPALGDAAKSATRLMDLLAPGLTAHTAIADVFQPATLARVLPSPGPDLVVTDVPYGDQTGWLAAPKDPIDAMVTSLSEVLPDHAVIAICARTRQIRTAMPVLERFRVGTRSVAILSAGRVRQVANLGE